MLVLSRGKRTRVLVGRGGREIRSPPAGRAVLERKGPGEAGGLGVVLNYWGASLERTDLGRWVVALVRNQLGERPQRGLDLR